MTTLPTASVVCQGPPGACFCHGRRYTCPRCRRFVPLCFGAADAFARICDDCSEAVRATPEAERWVEPGYCVCGAEEGTHDCAIETVSCAGEAMHPLDDPAGHGDGPGFDPHARGFDSRSGDARHPVFLDRYDARRWVP